MFLVNDMPQKAFSCVTKLKLNKAGYEVASLGQIFHVCTSILTLYRCCGFTTSPSVIAVFRA